MLMRQRFIQNTYWLLLGRVFQMAIQFIIGVLSARYLGPVNFGSINYIAAFINFFISISSLGLDGVLVKELVDNKDEENSIIGTAILMRFIAGVLSFVILLYIFSITDGPDSIISNIAILMSFQIPLSAFLTIRTWYQSQLLSKKVVTLQSFAYFVTALFKVFLLVTKKNVEWFALATTFDIALIAIFFMISYKSSNKNPMKYSLSIAKRLIVQSFPFLLASLMIQIYAQTDKIMVKNLLGSVELVGIYSVCIIISNMVSFIPAALIDSGRPIIMELKQKKSVDYATRMRQLIAGVFWVSVFFSFFISLFSTLILNILYGEAYISGSTCLKIVVWYTAFSYIGGILSVWLICEGQNKYVFFLSFLGAFTNVVANIVLIPLFGINGAAFATLVTQLLANIIYPSFFIKTRGFSVLVVESILLKKVELKKILNIIWRNR